MKAQFVRVSAVVGVMLILACRALHSENTSTGPATSPASHPDGRNDRQPADSSGKSGDISPDSAQLQQLRSYLKALQVQLDDLLTRVGSEHPDVKRVQHQIARVEQELREAGAVRSVTTVPTTQPEAKLPDWEKWTVRPSHVSEKPFQYKLLPDLVEQTPGNAVPLYLMARRFWPNEKTTNDVLYPESNRFDYLDTPIDQFPHEDAEKLLAAYADTLALIDQAARRTSAYDWPDTKLEPKLMQYRTDLMHARNLLRFRTRYQVSQRDWNGAAYTLQTSFAMARHLGSFPLMYHALQAANGVDGVVSEGVSAWIKRGDSPNLYWALSNLPHPFIEIGPIAQYERVPVGQTPLDRAERGEDPQESWMAVDAEMIDRLQERRARVNDVFVPGLGKLVAKQLWASTDRPAREYLRAAGTSNETVGAMASDEAVGRYFCQESRAASDQLWKCWGLPYPQAEEQMLRAWQSLAPDQPPLLDNPVFQAEEVLVQWSSPESKQTNYRIPLRLHWRYLLAKADRTIALYQTIEALRDYAARHDGRPPDRLDQVTDLPIPLDPITGKPFSYTADGQTARLVALTPWWWRTGWRIELNFVK